MRSLLVCFSDQCSLAGHPAKATLHLGSMSLIWPLLEEKKRVDLIVSTGRKSSLLSRIILNVFTFSEYASIKRITYF